MRAEISESAKASEDSCEESVPRVRTKPPRPRKKNKDPLFEEDVVEGFAFLAFKSYEDLEVRQAWGRGGRPRGVWGGPEPCRARGGRWGASAGAACPWLASRGAGEVGRGAEDRQEVAELPCDGGERGAGEQWSRPACYYRPSAGAR